MTGTPEWKDGFFSYYEIPDLSYFTKCNTCLEQRLPNLYDSAQFYAKHLLTDHSPAY